jgi:hypothetical protein
METKDILTIIAILLSPVIAVQVDKFIEKSRAERNRKIGIFKTLMATRGTKLSIDHVTALNQIDLEFYGNKKFQKVVNAWKEYLDQLNVKFEGDGEFKRWNEKTEDLLANLLFEMGTSLDYSFDRVAIRRNGYSPIGHGQIENENQQVRQLLIKILSGENAITTLQVVSDEIAKLNIDAQAKTGVLQDLLIDYYVNPKAVTVKILKDDKP